MQTSSKIRTYQRNECITFRKTKEAFGGLSNMAGGYPLNVNGIHILTSEALYQACRFPHLPDVQKLIIAQNSPMTAKMKSKPYRDQSRLDWDAIRIKIMRWCLRVKLLQNWNKFGDLLLSTEDKPIVEDSHKDDFWGAIPIDSEKLVGVNALGRLLMELREELRTNPNSLQLVEVLNIPDFLLLRQSIKNLSSDDFNITSINHSIFDVQPKTDLITMEDVINKQSDNVDLVDTKFKHIETSTQDSNNIFYDWVLPRLETLLTKDQSLEEILEKFETVNRKQMQDWLQFGIELGKVKKLSRPVRYILLSDSEISYLASSNSSRRISTNKSRQEKNDNKSNKQLTLNVI
jgi:ribA/ribD-fused uncharacterized protein